jgi:hypothetical protein
MSMCTLLGCPDDVVERACTSAFLKQKYCHLVCLTGIMDCDLLSESKLMKAELWGWCVRQRVSVPTRVCLSQCLCVCECVSLDECVFFEFVIVFVCVRMCECVRVILCVWVRVFLGTVGV